VNLTIDEDDSAETAKAIERGLESYNAKAIGIEVHAVPLNLAVRDETGKLCGGIIARTYTDTLYFETVWMDDSMRGKGHGRAMMTRAEEAGRQRGAHHAWLVTLSFQARPFYEKLGYRVFGEMPVFGGKHTRYIMKKEL
jgi:GNAT superfamily N-acetyltransferase